MFKLWKMQREIFDCGVLGCEDEVYMEKRERDERQESKRVCTKFQFYKLLMMDRFFFCIVKKQFPFSLLLGLLLFNLRFVLAFR